MRNLLLAALVGVALLPGSAAPATYEGHGIETLDPDQLRKFAPPALEPPLSRLVQAALDLRAPSTGLVSPDGRKLYLTWNVTGTFQVWRLDGPLRFPVQLTGGEDRTTVADVSPDGRFLVISRDRNGEENPGVYLQPTEGGPLTTAFHKAKVRAEPQFVTDDSRWVYFTANDPKPDAMAIYRYEVRDRKVEPVLTEDGLWSIADHRGDGSELLLEKATGNFAREYFLFNAKTRALKPLFGQGESQEYAAVFGAHPGELLVLTNKFSDFRRLYRWHDGEFMGLTPEQKVDIAELTIDRARTRVYYTTNEQGYFRVAALDARSYRPLQLPKFAGADIVRLGRPSRNGRFMTFATETGRSPRVSFVFDWSRRSLVQWVLPSVPEFNLETFVRPKLESFPARDGTKIPMFVRRPAACAEAKSPCPVVVVFHGGPESQAVPGFSAAWQLFVDAGYVVVEPNVRGSDGYGRAWLDSDNGPNRLKVITDIEDCAKFIRTAWAVGGREPKLGVMGWSYGGYSTLYAMTRFAGAYDAGVALVGMADLRTFLLNTAPYRRKLRATEYGDPEKDAEALRQLSPITYVDQVKAPLLIIQGANDPRVPAGEAVQMFEAMKKHGLSAELILFADEGHGAAKRSNKVFELGHALRFFGQHLGAVAAAKKP